MLNRIHQLIERARRASDGSRRSLVGASLMIVQPLLLNAISLPVTAFIIASLGPHDYGAWSVALMLTTTAALLTNVGLRNLLIRTVARSPEEASYLFAEHLSLRLLLMVIAAGLALLACVALDYPTVVLQCTAILAVGMLFTAVGNVTSDLLQGLERLPSLATINMVAGLLLTAASVVAVWMGAGPIGLAFSYLIGPVVTGISSLVLVRRRFFPVRLMWSSSHFKRLLHQSRHLGVPQMLGLLSNEAESLIVPKLVGIYQFGHFSAGMLLPRRLMIVPDGLNTAFFPVLTRKFHDGDHALAPTVKRFFFFMFLACVPVTLALVALADPISRLVFKEERELCRLVLQITAWAIPLIGFDSAMGYLVTAAGREVDEARLSVLRAVLVLAASVGLISSFGLVGASLALPAKGVIGIAVRVPTLLDIRRSHRASVLAPATLTS